MHIENREFYPLQCDLFCPSGKEHGRSRILDQDHHASCGVLLDIQDNYQTKHGELYPGDVVEEGLLTRRGRLGQVRLVLSGIVQTNLLD